MLHPNVPIMSVTKTVAVIVAHPDDETLWAGGTLLSHPAWHCFIVSVCRGSDKDRAPRFENVLKILGATGAMGDLDDGPEQDPLAEIMVKSTILALLPVKKFDLVITHNPNGEYTRHLRHEEVSKAVIELWGTGDIDTAQLWTFAYEDGGRAYHPRPVEDASVYHVLSPSTWQQKYDLMTRTYGFDKDSWEAQTTPNAEAFWQFTDAIAAKEWLEKEGSTT